MPTPVVEFLKKKFRETNYNNVSDWMKENGVDLALQTATSVLLRDQEKGLITMLTLAVALGCTKEELIYVAQEKGDKTLWKLFSSDDMTNEEAILIADYRMLKRNQRKAIHNMIREIRL